LNDLEVALGGWLASDAVGWGHQMTLAPIIYFNIGWMAAYAGHADDPISGGHQFLAHNAFGGEAFNFLADADGIVRGCRPGSKKGLRIERLGSADTNDSFVEGVTVVWMAREPKGGRTLIVGWYLDTKVYRSAHPAPNARYLPDGQAIPITAETQASKAVLLPPAARTFQIESRRTAAVGFGQSPAWYGDPSIDKLVRAYIGGAQQRITKAKAKRAGKGGGGRQPNPELRKAVEEAAIAHAGTYFRSDVGGACEVVSVEREAKGWDLEATGVEGLWLVEVKGLSGPRLVCEVTPNEFSAMNNPTHRGRYVVYVVCNALDGPIASIFRWQKGGWRTEDGRVLVVATKTGAVLSCE
jgi:hypothetical protein